MNYKSEMDKLYVQIEKHIKDYYVNNNPTISDSEFDILLNRLKELESEYPQYKKVNSPTIKVSGSVDNRFQKIKHQAAMLSLNNAMNQEELKNFLQKFETKTFFEVEPKIDGLAISLIYEKGILVRAVTRGDGEYGEDVTHNVKQILEIPQKISNFNNLEIRGEIYMTLHNFAKIQKEKDQKYANPRNLASGILRQLNADQDAAKLSFFAYGLISDENFVSQIEKIKYCQKMGFNIPNQTFKTDNISDVLKFIQDIEIERANLPYQIDGVVIKIDDLNLQEKIGYTSKFPKFAIAYKFPAEMVKTKILNIFETVGRTGKITPNAQVETVQVAGTNVTHATLHNQKYIQEKNINIGDEVIVLKAGDIIPRVEKVIIKHSDGYYKIKQKCPECEKPVIQIDQEYYCENQNCPKIAIEKMVYFVSKKCMNIEGLSEGILTNFYHLKIAQNIADLYSLDYDKIQSLDGWQEKSVKNLKASINKSKKVPFYNFINSLGIKNVGFENAKILAKNFPTYNDLQTATLSDLESIDGIGPIITQNIVDYFSDKNNLKIIEQILKSGVEFIEIESNSGGLEVYKNLFDNKKIVVTGKINDYNRDEVKAMFENIGAQVVSSVSSKLDYLVIGDDPGQSKMEKATKFKIKIIDFNNLLKGDYHE